MALTKASLIDVNGQELILDADADTSITADTDDQIDIKVGGTDTVVITGGAMALKGATPTLTIGDAGAEDTKIVFDGNAQDYYIGLDDSADDLIIGRGSTVGTTPNIEINESNEIHFSSGDSDVKVFIGSEGGAFGGNSSHNIRASGNDFIFNSADDFMYESGGTEVMRLLNDGNLLLGATSATASEVRIDVQYSANPIIQVRDTSNDVSLWMQTTDSVAALVAPQNNGPLVFNVGSSQAERARIDHNGGVAIGTTSIDNTTRLTVVQPNNDYPVARFDMSGAVNAIVGQEIRVTNAASNAANKFFIRGLDDTSTERFRFNTNGSGSMSGSLTQNSSDKRLKEEITTIENPLEKLKTLRGVNFTWKDKTPVGDLDLPNPNTKDVGVIAQEVQSVLPEAVELAPLDSKIDKNGNKVSITGENYLTVFEEKIVPLLIESIKEQQTQIEALQSEINTLKGG